MDCYKRDYVFKTTWCWWIVYQVHCNKQFTEKDENSLDKELEELERKIKAVSNFEIIYHQMNLWTDANWMSLLFHHNYFSVVYITFKLINADYCLTGQVC